jgi:hypothetical protein
VRSHCPRRRRRRAPRRSETARRRSPSEGQPHEHDRRAGELAGRRLLAERGPRRRDADDPHEQREGCDTYASLRIAEQRLSLQEIAEELGHSLEVLATHYAHVISEYARKGRIDPEKLIREARKRVAGGDVSRRTRRQMDAISPAAPSE